MWRRIDLVWTDVSDERVASISKVESPRAWNQLKQVAAASETSVHSKSTRRHIPEDAILHSRRRENLKSYNK
jgi:hypothetical protein